VRIAVADFWHSPLTPFDPVLVGRVRDAAARLGLPHMDMPTGIGHDAVYVARRVPAAMIFCPCHGGVSHNEAESITPDWAEAGLRVLADAVLATAGIVKG
jgi:N-carbamoyl-L-amino-acid hydrolase